MPTRKQLRVRKGATNMMLLANPNSGVPLAHNAAYLQAFLSPRGYNFSNGIHVPDRGDFSLEAITGVEINDFIDADGLLSLNSETGGSAPVRGSFPSIPITADALWIMSGRYSTRDVLPSSEDPQMTFRIGSGNATLTADKANVRIRNYVVAIGDHIEDSAGTVNNDLALERSYKIDSPNVSTTDPNYYIAVAALDRSANRWRQRGYRNATPIHSNDFDITADNFQAFNFKTTDDTGDLTESARTINGVMAGYSLHVFPDGLPADWEDAAFLMGLAWQKQNYTF